jgi:hypothetical protein
MWLFNNQVHNPTIAYEFGVLFLVFQPFGYPFMAENQKYRKNYKKLKQPYQITSISLFFASANQKPQLPLL